MRIRRAFAYHAMDTKKRKEKENSSRKHSDGLNFLLSEFLEGEIN